MRCNECNVDLGEEYTKCPLCGAAAVSDEPVLKGIETAAYPEQYNIEKKKRKYDFPLKFVLRFSFAVCLILGVLAVFLSDKLWIFGVPAVIAFNAILYFISGIFEKKGKLLHSLVALLATDGFSLLTFIISGICGTGLLWSARAFFVCGALTVILCLFRRKRAGAQLRALFSL